MTQPRARSRAASDGAKSRKALVVALMVLVAVAGVWALFSTWPDRVSKTRASGAEHRASLSETSKGIETRLVGRWVRPDGGYVLEIRSAQVGGVLEASYFNPSSIHVARAEWRETTSSVQVLVELRDVNYPGATYTLNYGVKEDRLSGSYYQPAIGQTFDVEFQRLREP